MAKNLQSVNAFSLKAIDIRYHHVYENKTLARKVQKPVFSPKQSCYYRAAWQLLIIDGKWKKVMGRLLQLSV